MNNARYIIMGRDECGDEFRPDYPEFSSDGKASAYMTDAQIGRASCRERV